MVDQNRQAFKKVDKDFPAFVQSFSDLLAERQVERLWESPVFATEVPCLLCAEHTPNHCHRRLVAEYFKRFDPQIEIRHLK